MSDNKYNGLSSAEAKRLLSVHGRNELAGNKKRNIFVMFLQQMNDFMIYTLIAAATISFGVSYMKGEPDYIEPAIILIIVVVNAVIGVIQESKAEQSINALKKMAEPHAAVLRDGMWGKLPTNEIVPGDVIMFETGNLVPADSRIISGNNIMIDESALTGESVPVIKSVNDDNMVYSGCMVSYGHGTALVTKTGMNTRIGHVADMLINEDNPDTPLQVRLAKAGKTLSIAALAICIVIFIMGLTKNIPLTDMFMTSVSLAVAAIPEGLPAIVTIMLSIGVTRMAANKAIIRKLPAVETLGSTTVICSDKTGTLTENRMTIEGAYNFHGSKINSYEHKKIILSLGALCNNSILQNDNAIGEPTENALLLGASELIDVKSLKEKCTRTTEYPFDSGRKFMTTIHRRRDGYFAAVKGAPDVIIPRCSYYMADADTILPMTELHRRSIIDVNEKLAGGGFRVIAVAYNDTTVSRSSQSAAENNLTFAGFITLIDPPRPEVKNSIKECKTAGIRTIMITGDHAATAAKIAGELGISNHDPLILTGAMLDKMSDNELNNAVKKCNIFARVTPEHKLRIVRALQSHGNIVAMSGDGVNDAPALKAADIGCAMGMNGTDVARNASDMILEDDNFATIAIAVREGRNIYDNIKKAIHFLISCNIGEILTIFMSIMFGLAAPLCPVQLLWINLITDSLPALSLGFEPPEKDIMNRPAVSPGKGIFSDGMGLKIFVEGIFIGSIALLAYALGARHGNDTAATMCFAVLGLSQISHSFNSRSEYSLLHIGIFSNPRLLISAIVCITLQIVVICLPALNSIFSTTALSSTEWIITAVLSLLPVPVMELQKNISK